MLRHRVHDRTGDPRATRVVLLHGGPGAPGTMAPLGRALADRFRVIEPFQRRSGGAPLTVERHVEDLEELLRALEPPPGEPSPPRALVGSSWGAMLGLAHGAAYPGSVEGVALVGCGTFDEQARAELGRRLGARIDPALRARLEALEASPGDPNDRLAAVGRALLEAYSFDPVGGEQALELERCDARGHRETWADALRLQAEGLHPRAFAALRAPVLMLHGDADPHPGPAIRRVLAPHLPQLEYVELADCGHYPWLERRAREPFLRRLSSWLEGLGRTGARGGAELPRRLPRS